MKINQLFITVFFLQTALGCFAQNSKIQKLSESDIPDFVNRECKIYKDSLGINRKQEIEMKSALTVFVIASINKDDSISISNRKLKIANLIGQKNIAFKRILTAEQYEHYLRMAERFASNAEKRRPHKQ